MFRCSQKVLASLIRQMTDSYTYTAVRLPLPNGKDKWANVKRVEWFRIAIHSILMQKPIPVSAQLVPAIPLLVGWRIPSCDRILARCQLRVTLESVCWTV